MNNWIYFVLISQSIWALTSFIDKIVISKGYIKNPLVYILLNGFMNILVIFLIPFFNLEPLRFIDIAIGIIGGIAFSASVAFYYKAVHYEDISKVVILNQLAPVFILFLSFVFLGEVLIFTNLIGFMFLIMAGVLVSYKRVNDKVSLSKAFTLMFFSALIGSVGAIIAKYFYGVLSFWSAFLWIRIMGFTALIFLLMGSVRRDAIKTYNVMPGKIKLLMAFKMVIDFSAFIFLGYALANGPVSLVSALSSAILPLYIFVLTLVTSIYLPSLIKEEIDKRSILIKICAFMLIIIGIRFVNI